MGISCAVRVRVCPVQTPKARFCSSKTHLRRTPRMSAASDPSTCCTECQQSFATRNELFAHLRSSAACGGDTDGTFGRKAPFEYVALAIGYLGDHFQVPPLSLRTRSIARGRTATLRLQARGRAGVCARPRGCRHARG